MNLNTAQRQLLILLKTQGPQTAAVLSRELSMSNEGVRLHLVHLVGVGLVKPEHSGGRVGRPKALYHLTAAGHKTFPDTHGDLTVQILSSVYHVLGSEAMDLLLAAREKQAIANYSHELYSQSNLEQKLEKLCQLRSSEGYMAKWQKEPDHYLFIENHCPIGDAAKACSGFCRAELNTFRAVLGEGVHVERIEHVMKGERRCVYRIVNLYH